jgi:hypothetical protein
MSIFLPFQVLFPRMPPIRRSKRVATPTRPQNSVQGQPVAALRSRTSRGMSRSAISQGADSLPSTSPAATTIASPAPIVSQPSLSAELISTLVSSVTTAVTQQLSALLPTTAATPIFPHEEGASWSMMPLRQHTPVCQVSDFLVLFPTLRNCFLNNLFILPACRWMLGFPKK